MTEIVEKKGNLFDSECQVIVNTINCSGVMGKGIALEFRYRYPDMFIDYQERCKNHKIHVGNVYLWTKSKPMILNFPTKLHWKDPSKLEYIESGLEDFAHKYKALGITSIAFPQLGTMSGGLDWSAVRSVLYNKLNPLDGIFIEIYQFDNTGSDRLFENFKMQTSNFKVKEFTENLGLRKKQARILESALKRDDIRTMYALQNLKGLGKTTIKKIYDYALPKRMNTKLSNW
ncbi:MAG: macro domain-containing protein [Candidatus Micrarchaeota archaeon]|nr:macro domain-containing protein [Candidatus Micrarchaeota archaeon]